jgi:nitroreductase
MGQVRKEDPMDFMELVRARYSVRAYRDAPVEPSELEQVLEAARLAPTADNRQPFRLIVIHTRGREAELRRIYGRDWFVQAPLVIAACAVPAESWVRKTDGKHYAEVDVAIVVDHLTLAAAELGLGTCWVAAFDPLAARQVLGLPEGIEPVAFTPLGHPADRPRAKKRRALAELVRHQRW